MEIHVKGDLDGTIFSYDCRMRFLECTLLTSCKNRTQLSPLNIAFSYDCRRILKHVLKSYDIFRVVCVCRKDVVGRFTRRDSCCRHGVSVSHATNRRQNRTV